MSSPPTQSADELVTGTVHPAAVEQRVAHQDWLLDQALLGTYPASDPVSVAWAD